MSDYKSYDYGFGRVWSTVHVERRAGYSSSVTDSHKHHFYEINLILSGNVKILLKDRFEEGEGCRIVLTRPDTAHFISCKPDTLYSRIYLVFTDAFIANRFPEWQQLSTVFGKNGTVLAISPEEAEQLRGQIEQIEQEKNPLGQRLLIYYLLLQILERHAKSHHQSARGKTLAVWEIGVYGGNDGDIRHSDAEPREEGIAQKEIDGCDRTDDARECKTDARQSACNEDRGTRSDATHELTRQKSPNAEKAHGQSKAECKLVRSKACILRKGNLEDGPGIKDARK